MKDHDAFLSVSIVLFIVALGYFIIGTGALSKSQPIVTGMHFTDFVAWTETEGYLYEKNSNMILEIKGVNNFKKDSDDLIWIDLNMRLIDHDRRKPSVYMTDMLGANGKTMLFSQGGIDPKITLPLTEVEPGRYIVEIDIIDKNADKLISTLSDTITII